MGWGVVDVVVVVVVVVVVAATVVGLPGPSVVPATRVVVAEIELHPEVLNTSAETRSDHEPEVSCKATQKKAPPLHANSPVP